MATVEVHSVTSALLPVDGTEVQQELLNVTKDAEVEAQATEETVTEEPKEELARTTESRAEVLVVQETVLVVQETENSKDQESKEVREAEIPNEEEIEEVVELQEAETFKEKESHVVVDVQESETAEEEESKELVQEADPISKEATEKMEVRAEDATTEVATEGRTEEPGVVAVEGSKEAVEAEEKNECASDNEVVAKGV